MRLLLTAEQVGRAPAHSDDADQPMMVAVQPSAHVDGQRCSKTFNELLLVSFSHDGATDGQTDTEPVKVESNESKIFRQPGNQSSRGRREEAIHSTKIYRNHQNSAICIFESSNEGKAEPST